jgi:Ser/Thr protein kinase RdoA (MazF antagonist)
MSPDFEALCGVFDLPGELLDARPWGSGHINDTYVVLTGARSAPTRTVLQRINTRVFTRPDELMNNMRRVTEHLQTARDRSAGEVLRLLPTAEGELFWLDDETCAWRALRFIEGGVTLEGSPTAAQAREGARAFGQFQRLLCDLPPPRLAETIPGFHDTPARFEALTAAAAADRLGRAARAAPELEAARSRRALCPILIDALRSGQLPERVVHNDSKLDNVLFDAKTGRALCVIDLDTVMPGAVAWDFGDLVRSASSRAPEDEADPERVGVDLELFTALVAGYLEEARAFLTPAERESLVTAGKLVTYELAMRFLTDYLAGDRYFKTDHPDHNLIRARAQFALVESLERSEPELARIVARSGA